MRDDQLPIEALPTPLYQMIATWRSEDPEARPFRAVHRLIDAIEVLCKLYTVASVSRFVDAPLGRARRPIASTEWILCGNIFLRREWTCRRSASAPSPSAAVSRLISRDARASLAILISLHSRIVAVSTSFAMAPTMRSHSTVAKKSIQNHPER